MSPRREADARLLEEDIGQYGPVLYENSLHFNKMSVKKTMVFAGAFVVMGVFMILLPIFFQEGVSSMAWLVSIFIGPMFLIIAYIGFKEAGGEFRIHERGIRFSFHKIPFIPFEEIDHIEKREGIRSNTPFTFIVTNKGDYYSVTSGPMKHVHESPENYDGFLRTLEKKLLETHPNENPVKLIRDVYNIPWEPDAIEELDKIKFNNRAVMVKVNDEVLEDGRFRVTLGDYIRYK